MVLPAFNEEGNIVVIANKLAEVLNEYNYEVLFVDDGSTDKTVEIIKDISTKNRNIKFLSLSRNFGHQAALKAGIDYAGGDCVITMDGDLEHPPELIPEMIEHWHAGNEVVITLREETNNIGFFKRFSSKLFYSIMDFISEVPVQKGSADFRLLDRKVVDVIKQLPETPIFLRAMVNWLGFTQKAITYTPGSRFSGSSKYSTKQMLKFSFEGLTSFSVKPLRISTIFGSFLATLAILYGCYAIYIKMFTNNFIDGWASVLALVAFLGGTQMLMFGILGEYLGKLFMASKGRPSYIIKEKSED